MANQEILDLLPEPAELLRRFGVLQLLDAIALQRRPVSGRTRYSYDPGWREGTALASFQNGAGDDYSIIFAPAGVYTRVFDHYCPMSPPGQ